MHDGMASADVHRARLLIYRDARRESRVIAEVARHALPNGPNKS